MSDFSVSTIFKAKDHVSAAFSKMNKRAKIFGNTTDRVFSRASRSASHFNGVLKGVLVAFAVRRGLSELQQGTGSLIKSFVDFDDAIFSAASKTTDFNSETKEGRALLKLFRDEAIRTGALTKFSATDAALGLETYTQQGFSAVQATTSLYGAAKLATVGKTTLADAAEKSGKMLGAFNLKSKDTNVLLGNMNRLNNQLAFTVTKSATNFNELFESITAGGPDLLRAGQDMETFLTLTAMLADAKVGEEAGTAIRNMALKIADPSAEARKTLQALGVVVASNGKDFDDFITILDRFKKRTNELGLGTRQKAAVFASIFQVRASTATAILASKSTEQMLAFRDSLYNVTNEMDRMVEARRKSFGYLFEEIRSNIESKAFEVLFKFEDRGRTAARRVIEYIQNIDTGKLVTNIESAIKGFKALSGFARDAWMVLRPFAIVTARAIKWLANNMEALAPYLKIALGYFILYKTILPIVEFVKFIALLKSAAVAQGILNVVMTANPIGAIIVGVAALTMAIVWMYRNWDKVKAAVQRVWNWFSKLLDSPLIAYAMVVFAPWITIPALIIKHWKPIKEFFISLFGPVEAVVDKVSSIGRGLFGIGMDEGVSASVVAPNQAEVNSKREAYFKSFIDVNFKNAPPGTTASFGHKGAPPIQLELRGLNP